MAQCRFTTEMRKYEKIQPMLMYHGYKLMHSYRSRNKSEFMNHVEEGAIMNRESKDGFVGTCGFSYCEGFDCCY